VTERAWRFIDSGSMGGADNMALDEAMLEAHAAGEIPPTLRVYRWRPPAVSLGRFQEVESSVDVSACRRLGVEVVRRPTGGRAILHTEDEVTFSLVVSAARLGATGVMGAYRALAPGIIHALRLLGLEARLVERTGPASSPAPVQDPACFAAKARCDLAVGAAKLIGSAQVQRRGFLLQQNSLPLRIDLKQWRQVFRREESPPEAVGLYEAARRRIPYGEIAECLRLGFSHSLGVSLADCSPSEAEVGRVGDLMAKATVVGRGAPAQAAQAPAHRGH